MLPVPSGYSLRLTAAASVSTRAVQSSDDSHFIGKETVIRCLKVFYAYMWSN